MHFNSSYLHYVYNKIYNEDLLIRQLKLRRKVEKLTLSHFFCMFFKFYFIKIRMKAIIEKAVYIDILFLN
jgi:hypothetical protein